MTSIGSRIGMWGAVLLWAAGAALAACGGGDDGNGSDLVIQGQIQHSRIHSIQYGLDEEDLKVWVSVEKGGEPLSDATVTFDGQALTFEELILEEYYSEFDAGDYDFGGSSTLAVTVGGTTYTQSIGLPGEIDLSGDGLEVSWTYEGSSDWLAVAPVDDPGSPTYDTYQGIGTSASTNIDSPQTIPASAYTPGGQIFLQHVVIKNYTAGFDSLASPSSVEAIDISDWEYSK